MPDTSFPTPPDRMTQTDFMACFGGIYEHSPWVAAALWDEGLGPEDGKLAHFAARMRGVVDAAPHERRLALLRAHPELAGKLAVADGLTAESKSEQAGAGLDRCTPAEFARFHRAERPLFGQLRPPLHHRREGPRPRRHTRRFRTPHRQ